MMTEFEKQNKNNQTFDLNNYKRITPVDLSELLNQNQNEAQHLEYIVRLHQLENYISTGLAKNVLFFEYSDLMMRYKYSLEMRINLLEVIEKLNMQISGKDQLIYNLKNQIERMKQENERTE